MKIIIETDIIKRILKNLQIIVPSFSFIPELTGIKIKTIDNKILFFGRNEENEIKIVEENVEIEKEGEIFVKFKTLFEIISKINEEKIEFSSNEDTLLSIKTKFAFFEINLLKQENETKIINEDFENFEKVKISKKLFKKGISNVVFSGDEKSPRKILQGINFIIENKEVKFISSDNIRISFFKNEINENGEINKIIPIKNIKNIIKIFDDNGEIVLNFSNNTLIIVDGNVLIKTKLIEGNFPKVENIFEKLGEKVLKINKHELLNMIDYSTSFNSNKYSENLIVKVIIDEGEIVFESRENEVGYSKVKTKNFEYNSEEMFFISLNPKLLFDALKVENSLEQIYIYFKSSNDAFILSYEGMENFKCLILPFKTI